MNYKEDIVIVDQVREFVPVIIKYSKAASFQSQVCTYRRRLVRYERYDPELSAFWDVQRLDKIVRILRQIRHGARRKSRDLKTLEEGDGNGSVLIF